LTIVAFLIAVVVIIEEGIHGIIGFGLVENSHMEAIIDCVNSLNKYNDKLYFNREI
jgi:hypothetical protein